MALQNVTASKEVKVMRDGKEVKEKKSASISYDFGATLTEAVKLHNEEVVFSNWKQSGVITLQGKIRGRLDKGKSQAEITAELAGVKVGVAADRTIDVEAAWMAKWASMTSEEKKAKLNELKAT